MENRNMLSIGDYIKKYKITQEVIDRFTRNNKRIKIIKRIFNI
jgi:hypothetical protein